jgi:hypothetical protein
VARFIWRIFQIAFNPTSTPKDTADFFVPGLTVSIKLKKNWFYLDVVLPFGQFGELEMIVDPSNVVFLAVTGLTLGLFGRQRRGKPGEVRKPQNPKDNK